MNSLKKKRKTKIKVEIYSKKDCHLCDKAKKVLLQVQKDIPFTFDEIDITQDDKLFNEFKDQIPVIFINSRKAFKYHVDEKKLQIGRAHV